LFFSRYVCFLMLVHSSLLFSPSVRGGRVEGMRRSSVCVSEPRSARQYTVEEVIRESVAVCEGEKSCGENAEEKEQFCMCTITSF
jgi:hypothetical protein